MSVTKATHLAKVVLITLLVASSPWWIMITVMGGFMFIPLIAMYAWLLFKWPDLAFSVWANTAPDTRKFFHDLAKASRRPLLMGTVIIALLFGLVLAMSASNRPAVISSIVTVFGVPIGAMFFYIGSALFWIPRFRDAKQSALRALITALAVQTTAHLLLQLAAGDHLQFMVADGGGYRMIEIHPIASFVFGLLYLCLVIAFSWLRGRGKVEQLEPGSNSRSPLI